jgi:hypothetical protein
MSVKRQDNKGIFRASGEVEVIASRAHWAMQANWAELPSRGFQTKEQEVEHQLEMLDSLCLNYLQARGKL